MSKHLRTTVGASVLSIGLLIGGVSGATATADPDGTAHVSSSQASTAPAADHGASAAKPGVLGTGRGGHATGPLGNLAASLRKSLNSLTAAGRRAHTSSPQIAPPVMNVAAAQTVLGTTDVETAPLEPAPLDVDPALEPILIPDSNSDPAAAETPTVDPTAPVAVVADPSPLPVVGVEPVVDGAGSPVVTPPVNNPTPVTSPLTTPPPTTSTWLKPVSTALAAVVTSIASVPGMIIALPTSLTPVADVISSLQGMLTSVAGAVTSFTQLPAEFSAFLGVNPNTTPSIGGAAGHRTIPGAFAGSSVPVLTAPDLAQLLLPTVEPGTVAAFDALPATAIPADVAATGVSQGVSTSGLPLLGHTRTGSTGVLSTVERVIGAFVASVSITALAAFALPGLSALLAACAAGTGIGYRQARAGATLPSLTARFVGSGPLGVVRSGSRIQLHSRTHRPHARRVHTARVTGAQASVAPLLKEAV